MARHMAEECLFALTTHSLPAKVAAEECRRAFRIAGLPAPELRSEQGRVLLRFTCDAAGVAVLGGLSLPERVYAVVQLWSLHELHELVGK